MCHLKPCGYSIQLKNTKVSVRLRKMAPMSKGRNSYPCSVYIAIGTPSITET